MHGVRTEPRPKIPALRQLAKRQSSTRRGRYIAELRNALGYSIRVARRKIVEVAKQWMQDAKQGPCHLPVSILRKERKRTELRQRTRKNRGAARCGRGQKRVDNMKSLKPKEVTCHHLFQVLRCCHVTLFGQGKVGPKAITTNREPNPCRVEHRTKRRGCTQSARQRSAGADTARFSNLADDERAEAGRLLSSFLMGH